MIYVAETTSGTVNIYGVPWDQAKVNSPTGLSSTFNLLQSFPARNIGVGR